MYMMTWKKWTREKWTDGHQKSLYHPGITLQLYWARGDGMMGATSTEAKEKKRKRDKDRRAEKRKLWVLTAKRCIGPCSRAPTIDTIIQILSNKMFYKVRLHSPQQPCGGIGTIFFFNSTLVARAGGYEFWIAKLKSPFNNVMPAKPPIN